MSFRWTKPLPSKAALQRIQREERTAALEEAGRYVQAKAAIYPPPPPASTYRRTGTLGRSIAVGEVQGADSPRTYVEVGTNLHYAPYVEYGTGLYGPRGQYITPKIAKFLAWKTGDDKWVFARRVRGMHPWHFMQKAFEAPETTAYFQSRLEQMLRRIGDRLESET